MPNWGAILVGGIAGLAGTVIVAAPLLLLDVADTDSFGGQAALLLIGFAAQVGAGVVAARIAGRRGGTHGGLAGLGLFAVVSSISIAAGTDPGIATLAFGAVVAAVLGTAGGVLVEARRQPPR
jgi:hypothetical protein